MLPRSIFAILLFASVPPQVRAAPLTPAQATVAAKLLTSDDPAERAAAQKGFRDRGESVRAAYLAMLEKAEALHKDRLKTRISGSLSVLQKFTDDYKTWAAAKDACLVPLYEKTDHEARKLADLARAYATAEKAMKDLSRHLKRPPDGLTKWETSAQALNEVSGELAWCRGAPEDDREHFHGLPAKERAQEIPGGREFLELAGAV